MYEKRFLPQAEKSKALGAKVIWLQKPGERYQKIADTALTDGLFGGTTFVESWVGWEGVDGSFILDLGEEKEFSSVEADFLHQLGQWILLPEKVTYSVSTDNQTYQPFGSFSFAEDRHRKSSSWVGKLLPTSLSRRVISRSKSMPSGCVRSGTTAWAIRPVLRR